MNFWDERYSSTEYVYGTEPNDFLKVHAGLIAPGGRVLCIAEGEGRNAVYLAGLGFEVLAVDQSAVGLQKAMDLAQKKGVSITTAIASLEDYLIPEGTFDSIVSIWAHVPKDIRLSLHKKVVAGLKPGGVLILEAYHPRQIGYKTGGPPSADLMMSISELKEELKGLSFISAQELERSVHEGKGHFGLSAVTQVLAKKL